MARGLTKRCRDELNSSLLAFEAGYLAEISGSSPGGASPPKGKGESPAR
jgi:hypothetical protein